MSFVLLLRIPKPLSFLIGHLNNNKPVRPPPLLLIIIDIALKAMLQI